MAVVGARTVPDGITEWWVHPVATALTDPNDRTVFGAVSSDIGNGTADVLACEFNHTTGTTKRVVAGVVPVDDHNCPAIWAAAGRRMVMVWTHHGFQAHIHVKVSDVAGNVEAFGTANEQTISAPGGASYTQVHRIAHLSNAAQDTFWLFTRIGSLTWRMVPFSVDQATGVLTQGSWVHLVTGVGQSYISTADAFAATGPQVIRVAWGYNPAAVSAQVYYLEINTVAGTITSPVDPTFSANLSGTNLPVTEGSLAPLLREPADGWSRRLFYVRPGPTTPGVAFAEWPDTDPDAATYKVAKYAVGSRWPVTDYGDAGPRIGYNAGPNYISGMAFPHPCPDDRVAVARQIDDQAVVELFDGEAGVLVDTDRATRLIRPVFPVGSTTRLLASAVSYYSPTNYNSYVSDVRALFADPVSATVNETDRVTILCGELRTGRILVALDVSDASWEQIHRDAGSVEVTLPDSVLLQRPELLSYLEGPRCYLAAQRRSTILEAGPIWMWDYLPGEGMKVRAGGLLSYFDHRKVMPIIAAGADFRRAGVWWKKRELGTIATKLVKLAEQHTGGELPIVYAAERSGPHERRWYGYELANMGTELRRLMEVENGPDIAFVPRLSADGLRVEWVLRVGTDATPMLTQSGPDWGWDTSTARGPVSKLAVHRDWSSMVSRAWGTGEGFEFSQLMAMQQDSSATAGGFPLLEGHTARSTVSNQSTLAGHAGALLAQGRRAWQTWDLTVKGDPHLAEYRPGDWGQVTVSNSHPVLRPLAGGDRRYRARILRLSGGLTDDVRITLAPMMEDR